MAEGLTEAAARDFAIRVAEHVRPSFPAHADAIRAAADGRLTSDGWRRVAFAMASLHAIPGPSLTAAEKDTRGVALAAVYVIEKMASAATFNSRSPEMALEFALWRAGEIDATMLKQREKERR